MSQRRGRLESRSKPFKRRGNLDLSEVVDDVCEMMHCVLSYRELPSFEAMYRQVYKVALKKQQGEFLEQLIAALRSDLVTSINPTIVNLAISRQKEDSQLSQLASATTRSASTDIQILLSRTWGRYTKGIYYLCAVMDYLNRTYLTQRDMSVQGVLVDCYHQSVLEAEIQYFDGQKSTVHKVLTQTLLETIALARDGNIIDHRLLKSSVGIFLGLGEPKEYPKKTTLYVSGFEEPFLESTTTFYREERALWRGHMSTSTYIRQVRARDLEELDRCRQFLPSVTTEKVKTMLRNLDHEEG